AHRLALPRDLTTDTAEADYPQRLSSQLDALEFTFLPLTVLEGPARLGNIAGKSEQHRNRVLRRGCGRSAWRIHDEDAALCCCINVHVIHPDACAADNAQPGCFLNQFAINGCAAAHYDCVGISDNAH